MNLTLRAALTTAPPRRAVSRTNTPSMMHGPARSNSRTVFIVIIWGEPCRELQRPRPRSWAFPATVAARPAHDAFAMQLPPLLGRFAPLPDLLFPAKHLFVEARLARTSRTPVPWCSSMPVRWGWKAVSKPLSYVFGRGGLHRRPPQTQKFAGAVLPGPGPTSHAQIFLRGEGSDDLLRAAEPAGARQGLRGLPPLGARK